MFGKKKRDISTLGQSAKKLIENIVPDEAVHFSFAMRRFFFRRCFMSMLIFSTVRFLIPGFFKKYVEALKKSME